MFMNNMLGSFYQQGKARIHIGNLKEAKKCFYNSYSYENNRESLEYYIYLSYLENDFTKIAKIFKKHNNLKQLGLYVNYWFNLLKGKDTIEILNNMKNSTNPYIKVYAYYRLSQLNQIKDSDIPDLKSFLSENFGTTFEEKKFNIYYDLLKKRYSSALIQSRILYNEFNNPDTLLDYIECLIITNSEKEINSFFEDFKDNNLFKKNIAASYLLSRYYYNSNNIKNALYIIKILLSLFPDNPKLLYNYGNLFLKQKKYVKALEYYEKALRIDPEIEEAYYNIGFIFQTNGDPWKASKYYEKALSLNKNESSIYNLAICLCDMKKYEDAYCILEEITKDKQIVEKAEKIKNWIKEIYTFI